MSVNWEPRLPTARNFKPVLLQKSARPTETVVLPIKEDPPTNELKATPLPVSDPIPIPSTHTSSECEESDLSSESSDEEVEVMVVEVPAKEKEEEDDSVVVEEVVNNTGLPIELSGLQVAECSGWSYINPLAYYY